MTSNVTVFINPTCEPCNRLKKWLKEKSISFIEKDLMNDPKAVKEFLQAGGQFTPTTFITTPNNERIEIIGANIKKIESILTENKMIKGIIQNDLEG